MDLLKPVPKTGILTLIWLVSAGITCRKLRKERTNQCKGVLAEFSIPEQPLWNEATGTPHREVKKIEPAPQLIIVPFY